MRELMPVYENHWVRSIYGYFNRILSILFPILFASLTDILSSKNTFYTSQLEKNKIIS